MNFTRQQGIIDPEVMKGREITLIGVGAVGSFAALALGKMGISKITAYDEDGVTDTNLPNQFYRNTDTKRFKVEALAEILEMFTDARCEPINRFYKNQELAETAVVATDNMTSRKIVWEQFKKSKTSKFLIEARMGAELGIVYTMNKNSKNKKLDFDFYETRLYSSKKAVELPCTAKSIIYNVLMISSLICRSYKGLVTQTPVPKELIFNMTSLDERTYMYTV